MMISLSILQVGETRTDPISHVFPSAVWAQGRERLLPELLCKLTHLAHLSPICPPPTHTPLRLVATW